MALSYSPTTLSQGALSTVNALLYTVPALTATIVKELLITNRDSVDVVVTLYFVSGGGPPATGDVVLNAVPINKGNPLVLPLSTHLAAGHTIWGFAGNGLINCRISGVEGA